MSAKKEADFSDMSSVDMVAIVTNTALVAKRSGGPVDVRHANIRGQRGILVFMPGFELLDGLVRRVEPAPAANDLQEVQHEV